MSTDPKDSAYPRIFEFTHTGALYENEPGLTKREHFAAMAMQGILASIGDGTWSYNAIAESAIYQADALITELNGPQEKPDQNEDHKIFPVNVEGDFETLNKIARAFNDTLHCHTNRL